MTNTDNQPHKNWAGNFYYNASQVHEPQTVEEVQDVVRQASQVKALGSRHSFNSIADTAADHISMAGLNRIVSLDPDQQTVTIEGGVRYGELGTYLDAEGFALHNMASLPHISVVGACATATHGSGVKNGNLATGVTGLQFVAADGELVTLAEGDEGFLGAVVGLGALGIVTRMTLKLEPRYDVQQTVYLNLPMSELEGQIDDILAGAYSLSLFTTWEGDSFAQAWLKQRVTDAGALDSAPQFYKAVLATEAMGPIADVPVENVTQQLGVVGSWHERLPHFRMEFTPSHGEELQTEYFVPRQDAQEAIAAMRTIGEQIAPHLLISEVRTIAADDLWLSPCYHQDCLAFHFTWKQDWPAVKTVLPLIESVLAPYQPRPHWGKLFTMPAEAVQARYERLPDFQQLIQKYDPQHKFGNSFLESYIYA
ncbi:FAD-binding protein [Phototrophicus methaneseepsis]|uniref:FAD-binding protein n=1 Tax=Phototrophicus methaneseepsis TaxID=2710758 RepID=A0A7S8E7W1_9CHLR|nr:FAD-binding protein [Phototrophicus methaneseepsis]QPC81982.1 FAD-binding protein [Phototrophicus methaneseepsis]